MGFRSTLLLVFLLPACTAAQTPHVRIDFRAQSDSFAAAVQAYQEIWAAEGERVVDAMERISDLRFVTPEWADTAIVAVVMERASNSGYRERPMTLRASYPPDTKRATLVHELGHRLQSHLFRADEDEHEFLFLWVYDVWVDLWGQEFADEQVVVEKRRGERYVRAWDAAFVGSREERAARWAGIRDQRIRRRSDSRFQPNLPSL